MTDHPMEENNTGTPLFQERAELGEVRRRIEAIRHEIAKIIVGQEDVVELIIIALLCRGHVLLEGNPGVAKTLTAKLISKTIDSDFSRIQFTPDLMPSDVTGTSIFNFKNSEFEFKKGPIFSNIILIDEINRAPAKTQAALFEVMQERQVTIDGHTYPMDNPFIIIATQNPIELEGTYRLPEAQMDRFIFKINVGYPNLNEEVKIIESFHKDRDLLQLSDIQKVVDGPQLLKDSSMLKHIVVEDRLIRYIAQIVQKTRNHASIAIGASPRASLALLHGAKAMSLIRGRDFVTPEDIVDLSVPVLSHRISISAEREMEGTTASSIIIDMVKSIEVPR